MVVRPEVAADIDGGVVDAGHHHGIGTVVALNLQVAPTTEAKTLPAISSPFQRFELQAAISAVAIESEHGMDLDADFDGFRARRPALIREFNKVQVNPTHDVFFSSFLGIYAANRRSWRRCWLTRLANGHCWGGGTGSKGDGTQVGRLKHHTAIRLTRFFSHKARRVYGMLHESPEDRDRRKLVELIAVHGGEITPRDLMCATRRVPPTPPPPPPRPRSSQLRRLDHPHRTPMPAPPPSSSACPPLRPE